MPLDDEPLLAPLRPDPKLIDPAPEPALEPEPLPVVGLRLDMELSVIVESVPLVEAALPTPALPVLLSLDRESVMSLNDEPWLEELLP